MSKNRLGRIAASLVVAFTALFFAPQPASAGVDDFEFESMHVEYALSLGEHNIPRLDVIETLVAVFPETDQNRGIRRLIPNNYQGHTLDTNVTSVVDETGQARDFSVDSVDGFFEVVSKHNDDRYVHGRQTYVISYSQKWVVGDFGDTDEFYWDVNGTGWAQPFGKVTATVTITPELSKILQADGISCYVGAQGATEACDGKTSTEQGGVTSRVDFSALNLGPGETLTINLPFNKGIINTGDVSQVSGTPQYLLFWALIAFILGVLIWAFWYRVAVLSGRRMRKFITVQYSGPETPDLSVVGSVVGGKRWQAALIVQAAVRGYLTISTNSPKEWFLTRTDKAPAEPEFEWFIDRLFSVNSTVTMSPDIDEVESIRIVNVFDDVSKRAEKVALEQGYYSHFAVKIAMRSWLVIIAASVGLVWTSLALDAVVGAGFLPVSLLIALAASIVHLVTLMTKRLPTQAGIDLTTHLEGLRQYIRLVEKDRLAFLQSPKGATRERGELGKPEILHLYEQVLPWAVLLGLEEEWGKVLTAYYAETGQPVWIPIAAVSNFNLSELNSAITQSLAVSSSSGSDGGGSAGGGGGGGGGGGV